MQERSGRSGSRLRRGALAIGLGALAGGLATAALAEIGVGVAVEGGVSLMGGPIAPHLAQPDAVTRASVDGVTGASRVASSGGVHVDLARRGLGSLSLGLEYVHYRFDVDYQVGRADMDVLGLRLLATARLPLLVLRGAPVVLVGFGGYLELSLYDAALLSGSPVNIELRTPTAGLAFELVVRPYAFELPRRAGRLSPGLYARAYRGLVSQLEDELGSDAPLSSAALGLELRWELPRSPAAAPPGS